MNPSAACSMLVVQLILDTSLDSTVAMGFMARSCPVHFQPLPLEDLLMQVYFKAICSSLIIRILMVPGRIVRGPGGLDTCGQGWSSRSLSKSRWRNQLSLNCVAGFYLMLGSNADFSLNGRSGLA